MADYTLVFEPPPTPGRKGPPPGSPGPSSITPLADNLARVSQKPGEPARVVTYDNPQSARAIASQLRQGKKLPNRPVGEWEFKTGETDDGRFGIWAIYQPSK